MNPTHDYLKYWKVVRYYIKRKYGLSQADLDIILFLYSEDYFSKDKFNDFDKLLTWDKNRFDSLRKDGWITVFRKNVGNKKGLYELSYKAKRVANSVYKKLNGEEIPSSRRGNPMYERNVGFSDKVHRNFITKLNASIQQQLRHPRES